MRNSFYTALEATQQLGQNLFRNLATCPDPTATRTGATRTGDSSATEAPQIETSRARSDSFTSIFTFMEASSQARYLARKGRKEAIGKGPQRCDGPS